MTNDTRPLRAYSDHLRHDVDNGCSGETGRRPPAGWRRRRARGHGWLVPAVLLVVAMVVVGRLLML